MQIPEQVQAHQTPVIFAGSILLLLALATAFAASKKVSPVGWGWHGRVNADSGVAIKGYDPVSVFNGAAALGMATHESVLEGTRWRFVSAENQAAFEREPRVYMPAYGGFCSFAMTKGFTADSDPAVHAVRDGRVYLFDSADMRAKWFAAAGDDAIAAGDAQWATH